MKSAKKETPLYGRKQDLPQSPPLLEEALTEGSPVLGEPAAVYMVKHVREGLPFRAFDELREKLGVTEERLGDLLGISRATLHRRKKAAHLESAESDRLARFDRLFTHAVATFGEGEAARSWLGVPALAFDWETPLDYADTEIGAQAVDRLLGRLEHGIFP